MKKLKTNKQLNAALDKLQKEFNEFKKGGWQNAPTPENLKPSKSGELEKQEEDIWFEGNYVTNKKLGGLFIIIEKECQRQSELVDVECVVAENGWQVEEIAIIKKHQYEQAPDSMILDYLMKGYREKGWKEGCEFYYTLNEYKTTLIAKRFCLKKQFGYSILIEVNDKLYININYCTLLPEKLTFAGEIIELAYDEYHKEQYLELDTYVNRAYKEDLKFFKDHLIPERKAEVERILKAMEE